jgi:predicted benzoate:H+ symporter BenE
MKDPHKSEEALGMILVTALGVSIFSSIGAIMILIFGDVDKLHKAWLKKHARTSNPNDRDLPPAL